MPEMCSFEFLKCEDLLFYITVYYIFEGIGLLVRQKKQLKIIKI